MIKQLTTLGIGILLCSSTFAQSVKNKATFDLSAGLCIPTGDYASSSVTNNNAGLATVGGTFAANVNYLFTDNLGFASQISYLGNGVNTDVLYDLAKKSVPQVKWTVEATAWSMGRLMVGLFVSLPVNPEKTVAFEPYYLFGGAQATSSKVTSTGEYNGVKADFITHESTTYAFTYQVGVNFRAWLTPKVSLLGGLDYSKADCSFKNVKQTSPTSSDTKDASMIMTNVTLRAGVGLAIN